MSSPKKIEKFRENISYLSYLCESKIVPNLLSIIICITKIISLFLSTLYNFQLFSDFFLNMVTMKTITLIIFYSIPSETQEVNSKQEV